MSKKDFIALADMIRSYNKFARSDGKPIFGPDHLELLADFQKQQNYHFMRDRWLAYIAGECGPNGGKVA